MTQEDRDRLVALKKAKKGLITQREAALEIGQSERHVRRLLVRLKSEGDRAVVHALRGRPSNRKMEGSVQQNAVAILSRPVYAGFGPTLAAEYLSKEHRIEASRETVRAWMVKAGLWRAKKQTVEEIHQWRQRRSRCGELVQWDTSEHNWLEGRGQKLYLIAMIDDATGELTARFALHDSTEENLRLLWHYLDKHGRPLAFYTDKASLFQTAPKVGRDEKVLAKDEREPLPPTQIGRALRELQVAWIAAHSPQAKGRIERVFATAQDRLVKGLRLSGAATLEQANAYLEQEFLPWWNRNLIVVAANPTDAHRPLGPDHNLASTLSHVEARHIASDYTFQFAGKLYQIATSSIQPGLRGGTVRIERRLDGSLIARYRDQELVVSQCESQPKAVASPKPSPRTAPKNTTAERTAAWRRSNHDLFKSGPKVWATATDRTRTTDKLD